MRTLKATPSRSARRVGLLGRPRATPSKIFLGQEIDLDGRVTLSAVHSAAQEPLDPVLWHW